MEARDLRSKALYFVFLDGYHDNGSEPSKVLFSLYSWEYSNSVRYIVLFFFSFLNKLVRFIPEDIPGFCKRVADESDDQGLVILYFADCTTVTAEAVMGADGVKSHVRPPILGLGNHESHACYIYKCIYRGRRTIENAIAELGEDMATNTEMHLGLDGHVITLPVDEGKL
ncbi:uncharacterized protein EAE98_010983 [Botrytis deweyae]|uniref:FAD-binding domain-containing protein n=1 Tax=Botrytis deweyae TaxID=2478750 RepID=A0ABQ7I6W4_9HELO|nr:uncharacterized protein EAE98_010983 [Botrytis deweyae]KAF7915640.1 hypothetical protein EAE98_010983 [Botrytis deweyae]